MGFCSVPGCSNRSGRDSTSFHKFPLKNAKLLQQWIHNIKRKDFTPTKYSKVCGEHFTKECFVPDKSVFCPSLKPLPYKQLRSDAVPTVFGYKPAAAERAHTLERIRRQEVNTRA